MKFPIATALACGLAGLTAAAALAQPAARRSSSTVTQ